MVDSIEFIKVTMAASLLDTVEAITAINQPYNKVPIIIVIRANIRPVVVLAEISPYLMEKISVN